MIRVSMSRQVFFRWKRICLAVCVLCPTLLAPLEGQLSGYNPSSAGVLHLVAAYRGKFYPILGMNLQRAIDSVRSLRNIVGVSAAVLLPGVTTWRGVSGLCHESTPITPGMKFDIADNTIPFVSTSILQLAEEGLLSLDDSLGSYLPLLPNITGSVTIRQLLTMTSGLSPYDTNAVDVAVFSAPSKYWTPEGSLGAFVGPPLSPPGAQWKYCNTNYILLGMLIRQITGTSVSAQLRQRIFNPLSLDSTCFGGEEAFGGPTAHPWYEENRDISSMSRNAIYSIAWTSGAMVSIPEDMARAVRALFEGSLITPASLDQMRMSVPLPGPARRYVAGLQFEGYGIGVFEGSCDGKKVYFHQGAGYGYGSAIAYLPELAASFAVFINQSSCEPLELLTALLDRTLHSIAVTATPGAIDFGSAEPGSSPDSVLFKIRNVYRESIEIASIRTACPTPFAVFGPAAFPRALLPGDSLIVGVVFHPEAEGAFRDTILVDVADSALIDAMIPVSGKSLTTGVSDRGSARPPGAFFLFQNYPNPFNPTTTIKFQLSVASDVRLAVYDLLGREVASLVNGKRNPGMYETRWDASGLAGGVYFYRLEAGGLAETNKLLLTR